MYDIDKIAWIENRLKMRIKKIYNQGSKLNFRCFVCGDSKKQKQKRRGYYYKATGSYHCFNCDITMSGFKIVAELEKRPYKDVKLEYLQEKYGKKFKFKHQTWPEEKKQPTVDLSEFTDKLPANVFKYLQSRKVFDAPFLPEDYQFMFDAKATRIVIPWYLNGRATYYQKRALLKSQSPKYLFPRLPKTLFNIDYVDPSFPYIFLLEGALDAIFVKNGVAIGGKNLSAYQKQLLEKRWPKHELVYMFDNHYTEPELVNHILKLADREPGAKFILWPKKLINIKDVNQWIRAGGQNVFVYEKWLKKNTLSSLKVKFLLSSL